MAVKLHRCPNLWVKLAGHPCWRVQKALDEAGVEYELVPGPQRRAKRDELERLSGQRHYPVIEFEDGSIYREQSRDMASRIKDGKLMEAAGRPVVAQPVTQAEWPAEA
jgi:glutaredoxin